MTGLLAYLVVLLPQPALEIVVVVQQPIHGLRHNVFAAGADKFGIQFDEFEKRVFDSNLHVKSFALGCWWLESQRRAVERVAEILDPNGPKFEEQIVREKVN